MTSLIDDGYQRPPITPSEMVSPEDIKQMLRNYEQITDTSLLLQGDHIKYFETLKNGKYKYKPGGTIVVNKSPDYLVVSNGRKSWSVQLKNHTIFREIDTIKLKLIYDEIVKKKDKRILELLHAIEKLKTENNALKSRQDR